MNYREKLQMLDKLKLKRITSLNRYIDADIIAYKTNRLYSAISLLVTRKGIMQGGSNFALEEAYETDGEAIAAFISRLSEPRTAGRNCFGTRGRAGTSGRIFRKNAGEESKIRYAEIGRETRASGYVRKKRRRLSFKIGRQDKTQGRHDDGGVRAAENAAFPFPLPQTHGVLRYFEYQRRG